MKKLYINLTNHCNVACPFCCMSSGPNCSSFIQFDKFYEIIKKEVDKQVIVQLEGGEPTTHPYFYLFLEYLASIDNVTEIVIDTNALNLQEQIDKIVEIAERTHKKIIIKPSYNNYLKRSFNKSGFLTFNQYLVNIISACEFLNYIDFTVNIRAYNKEELKELESKFPEYIKKDCHIFNAYGRLENSDEVPALVINQVYDDWKCFASNGECCNQDLIGRAKLEKVLDT